MKTVCVNHNRYTNLGNPSCEEISDKPGLTVPDQALTMRQLHDRFVRGLDVRVYEGVYNDDPDMPDVSTMDRVEREELLMQVRSDIKRQRQRMQELQDVQELKTEQVEVVQEENS